MIQANELRLGNLVYLRDREGYVREIVIEHLQKDKDMRNFEPIEIDEEWLDRLGFEKSNRIDSGERKPCYCIFSLALMIRHNSFFIDWIGGNTEIKYVHQLQNLYFDLTGEELELTNSNKSS